MSAVTSERGGVLPFVALTISVVVIGASFAVDLGVLSNSTRDMQKVADLAALDSAWVLDGSDTDAIEAAVVAAAHDSATRNGHTGPDDELVVTVGDWDEVTFEFTPTSATQVPDAVRVEAATIHQNFLQPGSNRVTRSAVAARQMGSSSSTSSTSSTSSSTSTTTTTTTTLTSTSESATFTAGSRLASVSSYESELLNNVFSDAFGGGVALTALDYEGVANATLTMSEIGSHLSSAVGTPSELAAATVTVDDLLSAMASALTAQGDAAAASVVSAVGSSSTSLESVTVTVGDVLSVASGGDEAATAAELDVLGILTGAAFVADGDSFVDLPSLTLGISGVTSTTAGLRIVEGPRTISGPVGTVLSTSQAVLELRPNLDLDLSYLATGLRATGTMPVDTDLAGLVVTLVAMPCSSGTTTDLDVDPRAAAATVTSTMTVRQTVLGITSDVLTMRAAGNLASDPASQVLGWLDSEIPSKRTVGSPTAGLDALDLTVSDTTVVGVLPLPLDEITTAVVDELETVLAGLDTAAIAQVADLLGISFAGGDVWLDASICTTSTSGSGGSSGGSSGDSSGDSSDGSSTSSTIGIPELVA